MDKDHISNNQNILTAEQVSEYLHIPRRTIYHLTKQGKIRGIKIGKHWRYKESDIERYFTLGIDFSKEPSRMPDDYTERRAYPRINCHIDCSLLVDLPQNEEVMQGTITNISGNGLLIKGNGIQSSLEDPVDIRFVIGVNGDSALIEAKGRVVRKTTNGFGVKFRNIDKDNQALLIKYVG